MSLTESRIPDVLTLKARVPFTESFFPTVLNGDAPPLGT